MRYVAKLSKKNVRRGPFKHASECSEIPGVYLPTRIFGFLLCQISQWRRPCSSEGPGPACGRMRRGSSQAIIMKISSIF